MIGKVGIEMEKRKVKALEHGVGDWYISFLSSLSHFNPYFTKKKKKLSRAVQVVNSGMDYIPGLLAFPLHKLLL